MTTKPIVSGPDDILAGEGTDVLVGGCLVAAVEQVVVEFFHGSDANHFETILSGPMLLKPGIPLVFSGAQFPTATGKKLYISRSSNSYPVHGFLTFA